MAGSRLTTLRRGFAAAALLAALAPGAAHAGTWLPPVNLDPANGLAPAVGLDGVGNTFAAWESAPPIPQASQVMANFHAAGPGGFPPIAVDPVSTDTTSGDGNVNPVVVTNPAGDGLVVWVDSFGGSEQIDLRTISPGGVVGSLQPVPSGFFFGTYANIAAAINANGDAVIAWQHNSGIEAITRQGPGGLFTNVAAPTQLDATSSSAPTVALDGAGNAIVAWTGDPSDTVDVATHPAGAPASSWSAPFTDAPSAGTSSSPAIAANSSGQLVLVLEIDDAGSVTVAGLTGTVSGGVTPPGTFTTLSQAGITQAPRVTVADDGSAIAAWVRGGAVEASLRPAGGASAFPAPTAVQSLTLVPSVPDNLALAGDAHGDAVVTWSSFETAPMQNVVRVAVRTAGSPAFGQTHEISNTSTYAANPTVALDQQGDAVVAYGLGATPAGVALNAYDVGPSLAAPSIPASATVGQPVGFSVATPTDAFASVSTPSWSFGDGSSVAGGTAVSHVYSKPGTYAVLVAVTDGAGVTVTQSGSIVVVPAPLPNCKVPALITDTLSQATKALKSANCALGVVRAAKPKKGHKLGPLAVISSSPGAGTVHPNGTKVNLALGQLLNPKGNALGLRLAHGCVDRRRFAYPIREPKAYGRVVTALIYVNGKLVKTVSGKSLLKVSLTKLPLGHFKVTVRALTTKHLVLVYNRTYSGCKTSKRTGSKHKG